MSTLQSTTSSPSRRTARRSTPWVLGCCGPMLSSRNLEPSSSFSHAPSRSPSGALRPAASPAAASSWSWTGAGALRSRSSATPLPPFRSTCALPPARGVFRQRLLGDAQVWLAVDEVLAQRVALVVVFHQDAPQVGMAFEADAEHVVDLPFVPGRGGPDGRRAGKALAHPVGQLGLEDKALAHAASGVDAVDMGDDVHLLVVHIVNRGEACQEIEAVIPRPIGAVTHLAAPLPRSKGAAVQDGGRWASRRSRSRSGSSCRPR